MNNDTTRDAFEAWFTKNRGYAMTCKTVKGGYLWVAASEAWETWQAATEPGKRQPLTDRQIDDLAANESHVMPRPGVFELTVPMLRRIIEAAHGITATPQGNP